MAEHLFPLLIPVGAVVAILLVLLLQGLVTAAIQQGQLPVVAVQVRIVPVVYRQDVVLHLVRVAAG